MSQQSIFGRMSQLARANINAILDSAEDPEKMLDQMIRDYTDNIAEAREAVAQTIGDLRMMEQDLAETQKAVAEWGGKAATASAKADEMRAAGNTSEADRFDGLAKVALEKQIDYERQAESLQATVAHQTDVVEKLKAGLTEMENKLEELKSKRSELVARAKVVDAQAQVADSMGSIDMMDPTSELSRFEEKIRREEAKVMGQSELAASSLDAQFESLEATADEMEVEARLAALKGEPTVAPNAPELDYTVDADVVEPDETTT